MANGSDVIHVDQTVEPGTHALVVGVGKYPHLSGGGGPLSQHAYGMQQLSSPPVSARAFADWLLTDYQFPDKELASVSLLLSEDDPKPYVNPRTNSEHTVAQATADNVARAVANWKRRGGTTNKNRLVFYFCGHGISQGNDMALLTSDYGADDDNPLLGALDLRQLMGGLKKCAAAEQLFFVDACRASSDTLIERSESGFAGQVPLLPGNRPSDLGTMASVAYYATLAGAKSHARQNAVSLFTGALIRSLRGAGSDELVDEDWRVTTTRLQEALGHFLKEPSFAGKIATVQVPVANNLVAFEFHRLRGLPTVPVYVGCRTRDENARALFVCRRDGLEQLRREAGEVVGDDDNGEWTVELEPGRYEFVATVTPEDVRTLESSVRPVFRRLVMEA